MLLAGDVFHAVVTILGHGHLTVEGNHLKGFVATHAGADVGTVAAAQTVEHVDLLNEVHTLHGSRGFHFERTACKVFGFYVGHHKRTDGGVGANKGALVTLDTVVGFPNRYKGGHTSLLVGGCALCPGTVFAHLEGAHGEQVAVLGIDGADEVGNVGGLVTDNLFVLGQVGPSGVYGELLVFAAAVYGLVVLVYHVLTLLAVALDNEFLHLLNGQVDGDDLGDAEECRLQDGVGAVAKTDFLGYLGGVDVVDGDVVFGKITLGVVGQVGCEFFAIPDGVEQEGTAIAQAAQHVIHVQISLYVASHEVGGLNLIGRADGGVAEAQV